jgi:hypothetical protein
MSPMLALVEQSVPSIEAVAEAKTRRPLLHIVALGSITVSFLAASAAPTPLYATYQQAWGFSDLTVTVIFGVYALAFLAALLTLGRISDHIGRRPVLFAGIAGQLVALAIFVDTHSLVALLVARIVQGLAAGTAIGAIGAGMLDIDPVRGAVANASPGPRHGKRRPHLVVRRPVAASASTLGIRRYRWRTSRAGLRRLPAP